MKRDTKLVDIVEKGLDKSQIISIHHGPTDESHYHIDLGQNENVHSTTTLSNGGPDV